MTGRRWWLLLAGIGFGFWVVGIFRLDPDFGWHVRVGQLIASAGIPETDPFSYTMPSFPWVDHGLGSDLALGWLYPMVGMAGLSAIFALMVMLVVQVSVPAGLRKWCLIPVLLAAVMFSPRAGVRPQVQDWLYLAILLRWWQEKETWRRWRGLVPVFFALWANMHGGWAAGLGVMGGIIAWSWVEEERREIKDGVVWALSVLGTLMTPYGWRLWHEVWLTVSDGHLRKSIAEWQPFFFNLEFGFLIGAVMLGMLGWHVRNKIAGWQWVAVIMTFVAAITSLRHGALFAVVMIGVLTKVISHFYEEFAAKGREVEARLKVFYKILTVVVLVVTGMEVLLRAGEVAWVMRHGNRVPEKAVEFLKNLKYEGELFSEYGWGGFLIRAYPEKKTFVDGRMPSWRYEAWPFREEVPEGESEWAFKEYLKIADKGEFEEAFRKYNVAAVLWPKAGGEKKWEEKLMLLVERLIGLLGKEREEKKGLIEAIIGAGWERVYEDEVAEVYTRGRWR